ncbi:reverse transcriptase domain-containing protein [Tanacetum coccineum]
MTVIDRHNWRKPDHGVQDRLNRNTTQARRCFRLVLGGRFIAEHELKIHPHIEPRVQRKRSIAPDRRNVVKEEVAEWLKTRIVKRMAKKDEEKTALHTDEGVFCYTKMPFGLKNVRATYQRLVDTIFEGQMGRNLEAYVDDMVIKSKTELDMIKDIEETLLTLKKVNMKLNPKKCSFGMEEGKFLGYIVTSERIRANPKKTKDVMDMPSPSSLSGKLAALNRFLSKAAERVLPSLDTLKNCANKKDFRWTAATEEDFQSMKKLTAELPTLTTPIKDEELMVYLSLANEAISAVLLVERNGRQIPIHYISRALQGAEINYPLMEKLALALVYSVRRLRRYFQEDIPAHTKAAGQEETSMEGKVQEVRRTTVDQIPTAPPDETNIWKLYTDGASNDHISGAGLILIDSEGVEYSYALRLNFTNLNNDAEYEALLAGLRIAAKMKVEKMHALVDSKLVTSQVEGSYEAKGEKTKKYREKILKMLAYVQCEGLTKGVLIEELNERSVDMAEVNTIVEEAAQTWMTPIQEYIAKGILPEDTTEA